MKKVTLYTSSLCPFCIRALQLLDNKDVIYQNISVDGDPGIRQAMTEKAGRHTVPQIWIGDLHVGGCNELFALESEGQLENLLKS
ncbi:MAG: glutaredoxin 3 [Candidatus Endonucleobacter bathymodioli]|uniref:Glutaredoxin n=1 Tax=Candidatus Endonucleibacter bathymodioli TaxID=539814 RepID=A0AA90SDB2_9GAMM|nr:glutaredoxin 3 [Candidatus Endonucleobacter bathymodioli]